MSLDLIVHEVKELLADTIDGQRQARAKLNGDDSDERVAAAGDLLVLKRRETILRSRLEELQHSQPGWTHEWAQWLREQLMLVRLEIDHWVTH